MEQHRRTIVKSIAYRAVSLMVTIPITGLNTAVGLHLLLTVVYFIHERIWSKIKWGVK
jgi:uncharacterized membrane protein